MSFIVFLCLSQLLRNPEQAVCRALKFSGSQSHLHELQAPWTWHHKQQKTPGVT